MGSQVAQTPVVSQLLPQEEPDRVKLVYLVTFVHPARPRSDTGQVLRSPDRYSRKDLCNALLDSFAHPVYGDVGNQAAFGGGSSVRVLKMVVFAERHKPNDEGETHWHYHVALKADRTFRYLPIKRALMTRHSMASHWSCTHDGYWSTVRYGSWPSSAKPLSVLDPTPLCWSLGGPHEPLWEAAQEPTTAAALEKRRLKAAKHAAEEGREEPRVSEIDVWPIIVRHGIRSSDDDQHTHRRLIEVAIDTCSPAFVSFLFRIQKRLPGLIDDVCTWQEVHDIVVGSQMSRMQCLS